MHDTLWQENGEIAAACLRHPFVRGLAEGSLDSTIFRRYVAQDVFFLQAYSTVSMNREPMAWRYHTIPLSWQRSTKRALEWSKGRQKRVSYLS